MSDTNTIVCQICNQAGHSALECAQLEAAAAERSAQRNDGRVTAVSEGAYAQLVNYGTITINQIGGSGRSHRRPNNLATLPATINGMAGPAVDPLGPFDTGVRKHHQHHGKHVDAEHRHHHHHANHQILQTPTEDSSGTGLSAIQAEQQPTVTQSSESENGQQGLKQMTADSKPDCLEETTKSS